MQVLDGIGYKNTIYMYYKVAITMQMLRTSVAVTNSHKHRKFYSCLLTTVTIPENRSYSDVTRFSKQCDTPSHIVSVMVGLY